MAGAENNDEKLTFVSKVVSREDVRAFSRALQSKPTDPTKEYHFVDVKTGAQVFFIHKEQ